MESLPSVVVSESERKNEKLTEANLARALHALSSNGFVVLDNAIDLDHLDRLRAAMTRDSQLLLRLAPLLPQFLWSANGGRPGHLQQSVPRSGPLVFRDILCNPLANQVTSRLLGAGAFFSFPVYNCNVNCPGSIDQDVHFDPAPPGTLAVNIALRDVSEADGAIELWPGSHVDPGTINPVPAERLAQRQTSVGPIRGATRKGSLMIRDLALWHRGRANPSQELRHMLAILHYPESAREHPFCWAKEPARFGRDCEKIFENAPLRPNVKFTRLPVVHQLSGLGYEMEQRLLYNKASHFVRRGFEKLGRLAPKA